MPVGGKLVLKGQSLVTKKKKKTKKRERPHAGEGVGPDGTANEETELVKQKGTGRIITSGTSVHGHGTKFLHELDIGDAIIIVHPTTLTEETRIVRMVLSDMSISISSPFSSDLISTTAFHYIKAPKDESQGQSQETLKKQKMEDELKSAYGTYAGGTSAGSTMTYRVKKGGGGGGGAYGGYSLVRMSVDQPMSREALLDMRSKKKSDRLC